MKYRNLEGQKEYKPGTLVQRIHKTATGGQDRLMVTSTPLLAMVAYGLVPERGTGNASRAL